MRVDGRSDVPAERERIEEVTIRAEMHQVALTAVVTRVRAIKDAAIRRDGWA